MSIAVCLVFGQTVLSQSRITEPINNDQRITIRGTSPDRLIHESKDTGRMAGSENLGQMVLLLAPTPAQNKAATDLVSAQNDPSSPYFHKWLTPAQFGRNFGVAEGDSAQVRQWLEGQGLTVRSVSKSGRFIVFSGNVAQVEAAFSTQIHTYSYNSKTFISNSTNIQLPYALRNVVKGVVRLHSTPSSPASILVSKIKVHFQKKGGQYTSDDGSHYIGPADFAKIYNIQPLYQAGINGTGETIAIVGESNIDIQDVRDFRSVLGLPANDPNIIINGDDPGETADVAEATLDVTWSGAIAPMAQIDFVVSQSNFAQGVDISAEYIVDNNLAPIMSTSYGECEADLGPVDSAFYNSLWQQAAAQGITSFVSAGDAGGADCDNPSAGYYSTGGLAVNGLASTPYNVAVGGTQFDDTADPSDYWSTTNDPVTGQSVLGYIPELVWNESNNDPNDVSLYAGGGGVSTLYVKPDWQTGTGVPADGMRDVPDISFTAALHDGYLLCIFGYCSNDSDFFLVYGGTSASSPAAAGVMALVNQKMGGQPQGVANYAFYRLASVSGVFHDTTKGNNKVPDANGQYSVGYDAGSGYDQASGLGSMDVNALVNHWATASAGAATTTALALSGQGTNVVHGTAIPFQATVTCPGSCPDPTGSVALMAASASATSVGAGSGPLTPLTGSSVANILTSTVPGGSYNVSARYSGDGKYGPSVSASVPVTVTPEKSQTYVGSVGAGTFATGPISVGYGLPWPMAIVVAGNSGYGFPTGQMTLTADGTPITTGGPYNYNTDSYPPSSLTLNYGEKTDLLTSLPSSQASTISYVLPTQMLGAGTHHLVATYPGDPSFGASQGSYNYNVTRAQGIIEDFFTLGDTVANVPVTLVAQVGFANNGFAPYGGIMTVTDITTGTPVVLGSSVVDSSMYGGYWSLVVTVSTAVTHILRLDYAGDANVVGTSQTFYVPFTSTDASYVTLSSDNTNYFGGQPVTLTAAVSSNVELYVPTGTVTFRSGTTVIGTAKLDATGTATLVSTTVPPGTDNLTASYSGDSILSPSVSAPLQDVVSDYILQALPSSLTIKSGQSGSLILNLIPLGGFTQTVNLACSGLPANYSCQFVGSPATLNGVTPTTITLTLSPTNSASGKTAGARSWTISSAIALGCLLLLPLGRRKSIRYALIVLCLFGVTFSAVGCGGGSGSSTVKTVTIMATSVTGTTAKSATVTVTITD